MKDSTTYDFADDMDIGREFVRNPREAGHKGAKGQGQRLQGQAPSLQTQPRGTLHRHPRPLPQGHDLLRDKGAHAGVHGMLHLRDRHLEGRRQGLRGIRRLHVGGPRGLPRRLPRRDLGQAQEAVFRGEADGGGRMRPRAIFYVFSRSRL